MSIHLPAHKVELTSLLQLLQERATKQPDKLAYTFLSRGETIEGTFTYKELDQHARAIAAHLQSKGACVGKPVIILHAPGLDYIASFFGCLYAHAIAVPAYPPNTVRMMPRIQAIVADTQAEIVLTHSNLISDLHQWFHDVQELEEVELLSTNNLSLDLAQEWSQPEVTSESLAFLQYTSGSTSTPKGVKVSHGNLIYNLAQLHRFCQQREDSIMVTWLPPYHDMGLIAGILLPLYGGCPSTIMSPMAFLQRPLRWLEAMSNFKATESFGPNFAFDFCQRKATPEAIARLDLSNWDIACNAAEPLKVETMIRFTRTFAPRGFRSTTFAPGYGLAEATLMVAIGTHDTHFNAAFVSKDALEVGRIVALTEDAPGAVGIAGYEEMPPEQITRIVNPETMRLSPSDQVGEIWVNSPSCAQGYWQKPEESEKTFGAYVVDTGEGPFLRTGDLGFMRDGVLYVTGRLKDLIIIRGRNYYPQDIEAVAEASHMALRPGCSAAFPIEIDGKEQLVIVAEVQPRYKPGQPGQVQDENSPHQFLDPEEIRQAIRRAVATEFELQVYEIHLLAAGYMFKTSSGKIQHRACKTAFLAHTLNSWEK